MPDGRKLEFISKTQTDFIFWVESSSRLVQFMARLVKPLFCVGFRIWPWLEYRRVKRSVTSKL